MFEDLRKEFSDMFADMGMGEPTRTLTVAKPYCSPARDIITGALAPYGVKVYGYSEYMKTMSPLYAIKNLRVKASAVESVTRFLDPLPTAQVAEVKVSAKAAAWAEYLLLRTGRLYVVGQYVNQRNEAWARKHGGVMPTAWHEGKPMIETSCKAGMDAWAPLRKATKKDKRR